MNKCEHKQKIKLFCASECCVWKEAGGCELCMKKYHNHLGRTVFLNEEEAQALVKKYTPDNSYKPKCRSLQEAFYNYFTSMKDQLVSSIEALSKNIVNQIGYPFLYHNNHLHSYKRLKDKEYKKLMQKQFRALYQNSLQITSAQLANEQKKIYGQQTYKTVNFVNCFQEKMKKYENLVKEIHPAHTHNSSLVAKINNIYEEINALEEKPFIMTTDKKKELKSANKDKKSKNSRNVSLDKKIIVSSADGDDVSKGTQIQNKKKELIAMMNCKNSTIRAELYNKALGELQPMDKLIIPSFIEDKDKDKQETSLQQETKTGSNKLIQVQTGRLHQPTDKEVIDNKSNVFSAKELHGKKSDNDSRVKYSQKSKKYEFQTSQTKGDKKKSNGIGSDANSVFSNMEARQLKSIALLNQSLKLRPQEAIKYLEAALDQASNNISAAEYLSYLYLEQERPRECLTVCNKTLQMLKMCHNATQFSINLINNKAAALNCLGRYSEAIGILEEFLHTQQKDTVYKNLGDAYFLIGILEKAIYNYEKAIKLSDQYTEAHFNLAVCQFKLNNFHHARIAATKALELNPTIRQHIELLNQINLKIKNLD